MGQAGRALWQELDNRPRNAQVWAWRLRQYDGNNGGGARLIEVETDSPLFVALWKKIMPANLNFEKEKKKKYEKSKDFLDTLNVSKKSLLFSYFFFFSFSKFKLAGIIFFHNATKSGESVSTSINLAPPPLLPSYCRNRHAQTCALRGLLSNSCHSARPACPM